MAFGRFPDLDSCPAAGVPWCSKNPYCKCRAEEHLSQGFGAPSSKNREQWQSGSPAATSLGLKESVCEAFQMPASACSSKLKALPITWYLLAAEHVHGVHALIIYALWTRIMFSSIFRKLTSNYILACSIICGPNFSSLKLFIISNLKNYRFAIFWCLSSVFSWHCLQSPLEGKVALSLPFVISYRWLHVLLQGS